MPNLCYQKTTHVNQTRQNNKFNGVSHKASREHKYPGKETPAGRDSDPIISVSFEGGCHHSASRKTTSVALT